MEPFHHIGVTNWLVAHKSLSLSIQVHPNHSFSTPCPGIYTGHSKFYTMASRHVAVLTAPMVNPGISGPISGIAQLGKLVGGSLYPLVHVPPSFALWAVNKVATT